jgi:hypothetical protein
MPAATCYDDSLRRIDHALCAPYPDVAACAARARDDSIRPLAGPRAFLLVRGERGVQVISDEAALRAWLGPVRSPEQAGLLAEFVDNDLGPYPPVASPTPRGFRVLRRSGQPSFVGRDGRVQIDPSQPLYCRPLGQAPPWLRQRVAESPLLPRGDYCETVFGDFTLAGTTQVSGGGAARPSAPGEVGTRCPAELTLQPPDPTFGVAAGLRTWDCPQLQQP